MPDEILGLLDEGVREAAKLLVAKVKEGRATASDIGQLRALFSEAGGDLRFESKPTETGDNVLDSLADVDQSLLRRVK